MADGQGEAVLDRISPQNITSVADIVSALSSLDSEDARLSASLSAILSAKDPIQSALAGLFSLTQDFGELGNDADLFLDKVSVTAETARRVGNRVRTLDEEMRRIKDANDVVGKVMELKSTLSDLRSAIERQDWEIATRLCARAMSLPTEVVSGRFADSVVPTAESPIPPSQALQMAREQLRDIFIEKFKEASQKRDSAATSRFFKLFPPIGWQEEGLKAYSSFVIELLQTKPPPSIKPSSPHYFIGALTALFESVCNIVDQHRPVVEKYYGDHMMKYVVVQMQVEWEKVVKRLLDSWEEERAIQRKLSQVSTASVGRKQDEETVDPREIDRLLIEISAIVKRFTAFRRFLVSAFEDEEPPENTTGLSISDEILALIDTSRTSEMFQYVLTTYYAPMESWYLRFTVNQAFSSPVTDPSQNPPTSSIPDLVFYLVKNVLSRVLDSGSLSTVERLVKTIRVILEHDFADAMRKRLDDVYRTNSPPTHARNEKADKESKTHYIILLNDLDLSTTHAERLVKDISSSSLVEQNFMESEIPVVKQHVASLLAIVPKLRSIAKSGIDQLFNQILRPQMRNFIPVIYREVSYALDEDGYNGAESDDIVRKRFVKAWNILMNDYTDVFTDTNYRIFIEHVVDNITRPMEKHILTLKFSELGAVIFDRDIRSIMSFLSSQTAYGDIRSKLQRLQQISMLLNIDKDEDLDEFFSSSGVSWSLSIQEAHAIVALKV